MQTVTTSLDLGYLELARHGDGVEDLGDDELPPAIGVGQVGDRPGRRHEDVTFLDGVRPPLAVLDHRHHTLAYRPAKAIGQTHDEDAGLGR